MGKPQWEMNDDLAAGYPHRRPARVRYEAIGEAWRLLIDRLGTWVVTMVILMVSYLVIQQLAAAVVGPGFRLSFERGLRVLLPDPRRGGALVHWLLASIVNGCFLGALFRMACRQWRGQTISAGDLFAIGDVLPALALGSLLYAVAVGIGFFLCFLPGLVFSGLLMFTYPLIVDAQLPPREALGTSWTLLRGQWLAATVFHLVLGLLLGLGVALCFVGVIFTAPLYVLAVSRLYLDAVELPKPTGLDPEFRL